MAKAYGLRKLDDQIVHILYERASNFNSYSTFRCGDCRYNCCADNLAVPVSLTDIGMMMMTSGRTVRQLYQDYLEIQGIHAGPTIFDWQLRIGLKKPCGFYRNNQCSIYRKSFGGQNYSGRPIACAIFPELFNEEQQDAYANRYPCVRHSASEDRINKLEQMSARHIVEMVVSSVLLFGRSPYIINIRDDLLEHLTVEEIDGLENRVEMSDEQLPDDTEIARIDLPAIVNAIVARSQKYKKIREQVRNTIINPFETSIRDVMSDLMLYASTTIRRIKQEPGFKEKQIFTINDIEPES